MRGVGRIAVPIGCGIAVLSAAGEHAAAQSVHPNPPPAVHAAARPTDVTIDGSLDEPAWQAAPVASDFRQQDPDPGAPATQRTEVRVLYDANALYVGARMFDAHGASGVTTRLVRRDDQPNSDYFMVVLDPFHDHQGRTAFQVNPSGAKFDSRGQGAADPDRSWDAVWEVATRIDSVGWTAELRIPFSQLRFGRDSVQTWGMQLWRYVQRLNETSQWAYWTKRQTGGPAFFGHLMDLHVPAAAHHAELLPYGVLAYTDQAVAGAAEGRRKASYRAGGDLKYLLTPNLAMTATINPDFGQVEVDPAVLNLSAFETFYPEKRPFFVEGKGLFDFGATNCFLCVEAAPLNLFYSRRVGRAPQLTPAGQLRELPTYTRILGATKLLGQTSGGFSLGVLDAVTAEEHASMLDGAGQPASMPVEPPANYFAGRAKWGVHGGDVVVGGMLTAVNRIHPTPELAALLARRAVTGGADLEWWWGHHTYHLQSSLATSYVAGDSAALRRIQQSSVHYFQRPDRSVRGGLFADGYDPSATGLAGYAAYARLAKDAGDWIWETAVNLRSPGFEVNDVGYTATADAVWMLGTVERQFTRPTRYFRSLAFLAGLEQRYNFDGDLVRRELHGVVTAELPNYWWVTAGYTRRPALLDDRLTRGGPVVMVAASRAESLSVATDPRHAVWVEAGLRRTQETDGGHGYTASAALAVKPASNVSITLRPSVGRTRSEAQYVTSIADSTAGSFFGRRYVFAMLTQRTLALEASVNVTFTPTLSLDVYAQPFLAGGAYDELKEYAAPRSLRRNVYGRDVGTIVLSQGSYLVDPDGGGPSPSFTFADPNFTLHSWRSNAVLRWEYRPGCTIYLVWTQTREGSTPYGDISLSRDGPALFRGRPDNVLMVKAVYRFAG